MKKEQSALDLAIINLAYSNLKNSLSYFMTMQRALPQIELDWDNLSRKEKDTIISDLKLTSNGVRLLQQAERYYNGLISTLEKLEILMDGKASVKHFDLGTIAALELQAVELIYTMLAEGNAENAKKIHRYLQKFKWQPEFKEAYENLMTQRNELAKQYNERHKEEIKEGKLQSA